MTTDSEDVIADIDMFRKGRKLTVPDVAAMAGIKISTFKQYIYRDQVPAPDGKFGPSRGPWWYEGTIARWMEKRKEARIQYNDNGIRMRVNRRAYDEAAFFIEAGSWVVYPETGIVDCNQISVSNNYLSIRFASPRDGEFYTVLMHRIIWEWQTGTYVPLDDSLVVDHINRIRYDNRLENLRAITQRDNLLNRLWQDQDPAPRTRTARGLPTTFDL